MPLRQGASETHSRTYSHTLFMSLSQTRSHNPRRAKAVWLACLRGLNHAKDADEDNSSIRVAECLEGEAMALIESSQVPQTLKPGIHLTESVCKVVSHKSVN